MARLSPADYRPILQYHFIVDFSGQSADSIFGVGELELNQNTQNYARGSDLPSADNNPIMIEYGNTYMWVKGKTRWNNITMQFYSLSEPNVNSKLWEYLNVHQQITGGEEQFKKDYVGELTIKLLNPDETPVGRWVLVNTFIASINFGNVNWGSEDVIQPEITFVYDFARWVQN